MALTLTPGRVDEEGEDEDGGDAAGDGSGSQAPLPMTSCSCGFGSPYVAKTAEKDGFFVRFEEIIFEISIHNNSFLKTVNIFGVGIITQIFTEILNF